MMDKFCVPFNLFCYHISSSMGGVVVRVELTLTPPTNALKQNKSGIFHDFFLAASPDSERERLRE